MTAKLSYAMLVVVLAATTFGCSSGGEPEPKLPVGSPCSQDAECAEPGVPVCLSEFKPIRDIMDPGGDEFFANIGFDFPGGYCSTQGNCHADAECGEGGACFWPLENVTDETLETLQGAGLPFDLFEFADMGLCMKPCTTDAACRDGYECAVPLGDFLVLVSGSSQETFCVPVTEVVDPCDPDPCQNGGSCADAGDGGYTCQCAAGYTGDDCETNIDDCDPDPCQNGGTCIDGVDAYTCECAAGYTGTNCETAIEGCDPNPCMNGGTCTESGGGEVTCTCLDGFTGEVCEVNIDDCEPDPCQNGGTCTDGVDAYTCECPSGFTGTNCETAVAGCDPNPCQNGGLCTADGDGTTCQCAAGFEGDHCEINIDECDPDPCQNGGTCTDGVNSYACQCAAGYTGTNCETDIDDCSPNPCQNGGTCTDGVDAYTCQCAAGFTGTNCETNIDDCDPNPCQNGGSCTDGADAYTCTCLAGFTGTNCETNIDDCDPDPCQNGGTCIDGVDTYTCQCLPGYTGVNCEIVISGCDPNPCQNGGTCEETGPGEFTCTCPAGFTGNVCEVNIDDCTPNPCQNGGLCIDGVDAYTCQCSAGFTGTNCEINIDDCSPNPCQNGGTCMDGVNSYSCQCLAGYTGVNCETNIDDCTPNPCQNGGTCVDGVDSYTCQCLAGYTGVNCETNIDDCSPNPCQNGGTCVDGVDSYTCQCLAGFTGVNCETNIDDCSPNPCQNGGTCIDGVDAYTCNCVDGYTGTDCELVVDCGPPPGVADGSVAYTDTTYGSTAVYSCDPGFVMDPPGSDTLTCQGDGTWGTPPVCRAAQVQNPGPVTFEFPTAVLTFTPTTGFDFDTLGPPECSDAENNDDFTAAGEGIQDSLIDFPDDPECSEALDDSECKAGFQPETTMTLTGTIDADGNINIPLANVVIPPVYAYSDQLGGDHVPLNTFVPTHDATGTLDPATGEVNIRLRFRLRFQGGTNEFNGPGNNCYIGTTAEPIDIIITTGTATSDLGKPDLFGVAYEAAGGTLTMVGYNGENIPGAATCGFLGFGNEPINTAFGTPAGPGHASFELAGQTTPVLVIP